jgi:hypothetical protein
LSSTDWTTFNSKQDTITNPITGTLATGQVAFGTAADTIGGDNGLFWDNTNKRLGVGTNTPASILHLLSDAPAITATSTNNASGIRYNLVGTAADTHRFQYNGTTHLNIKNNGNVIIQNGGTFTDAGFRLDVNGTARVQGNLTTNLTAGSVPFIGASGLLSQDNTNLFWDNTNKRLGVGTSTPGNPLVVRSPNTLGIELINSTNSKSWRFNINTNDFFITETAVGNPFIIKAGGNVLINTTTDAGFRLDVNGTARVQGVLTTTADAVVNSVSVGRGGGAIVTNTRVGESALNANTTGSENTAIGRISMFSNTTGIQNTAVGVRSLQDNTTGSLNTSVGYQAGRFITDGVTPVTIANNSVFIGAQSRANADNQTNQIAIGANAIGLGSNTTVIGNSSTTFGRWFGNLLVGTSTNAGFALDVNGTARVQTSLTLNRTGEASIIFQQDGTQYAQLRGNSSNSLRVTNGGGNVTYWSFANGISGDGASRQIGKWNVGGLVNSTSLFVEQSNITAQNIQNRVGMFSSRITGNQMVDEFGGKFEFNIQDIDFIDNIIAEMSWRRMGGSDNSGGIVFSTSNSGSLTEKLRLYNTGNLVIQNGGTFTDVSSAILNVNSTTQGVLFPRMTTTQKNAIASPATGLVVYDNTLNKLSVFTGATWETVTSL